MSRVLRLKMQHFHTKLLCQKSMLRQIKWGVQNGPITNTEFCQQLPYLSMYQLPKCPYS